MIAIKKLVLLIILLIIIAAAIFLISGTTPNIETLFLQSDIRNCCRVYRARGCPTDFGSIADITCPNENNLRDLIYKINITGDQLYEFCNCE